MNQSAPSAGRPDPDAPRPVPTATGPAAPGSTQPGGDHRPSATPAESASRDRAFRMTGADYVILKVLLALVALGALASIVVALWPGDTIEFTSHSASRGPSAGIAGLASNAHVTWADRLLWTISDPSVGQRILVALPQVFAALCVLAAALLVYSLAGHLARDAAFTRPALHRLRALALVLVFGGILWPFLMMGATFALVAGLQDDPSVLFTFSLTDFAPLLVGMLLLAVAEAFRRGIGLAEDVEGLV